jgi:BirA family biotin operon repressor/biotin-[acetyl-CoA-carboxylase] ligase
LGKSSELSYSVTDGVFEYHETLPSTQARARELAGEGVKNAVVVAGEQTAGRGRLARRWESPKGSGLYFSVLFRPVLQPGTAHMVNIAAAMSVAKAVRALLGLELELKWPNDLLVLCAGEYRKVCGILSESATTNGALDCCIPGIGLNLYAPPGLPPDLKDRAGWLCGPEEEVDRTKMLSGIIDNFFDWVREMESGRTGRMLSEYRERCASIGRVVRVETDSETLTGLCSGIGDGGELLVETPEGTRGFHVADVTHAGVPAWRTKGDVLS